MDCLKSKRDTPEKQMDYLLGQNGGFRSVDFKLYRLSIMCMAAMQEKNFSSSEKSEKSCNFNALDKISKDKDVEHIDSSEKLQLKHICDNQSIDDNCGCDLFIPKDKMPSILYQQTYNKWKAVLDYNFKLRQMRKRRVIYLQPLEHFPAFMNEFTYKYKGEEKSGFFNFLKDFLSIFFMGFEVRLLDTKLISEYGWKVKHRHHHKTGKGQFLVSDIYSSMQKAVPRDGYCMLGITWTDLYPSEDLNFVLGEASSRHNAAVFCFGRYEPKAYIGDQPPPEIESITGNLIWRMIKVISHETCHLYSVMHCVFFQCSMNESSSLEQALNQPLFLCPVCMKKIQKVCDFDILNRYKALLEFLTEMQGQYPADHAMKAITWLQKTITYLKDEPHKSDNVVERF